MATLEHCKGSSDISFAVDVYLHARSGGADLSGDYTGELQAIYREAFSDGRRALVLRELQWVLAS